MADAEDWEGGVETFHETATVVANVDHQTAANPTFHAEPKRFTETAPKVGWLWKKGGSKEKSTTFLGRRNWSKRWFVLEGTNLMYYIAPEDRQLGIPEKGLVVLNDFQIRPNLGHKESREHGFTLVSPLREFYLAADNDVEMKVWISYLQGVLDKVTGKAAVHDSDLDLAGQHYREGNKHLLEGNDMMAVREYTAAIGLNPAMEDAYYNRGISYLNTGMYAKLAISDFTQVLKTNPTCASAFNNRGISYKQDGKLAMSIADYRECLKCDPGDEYAMKNLRLCEEEQALRAGGRSRNVGEDKEGLVYRQGLNHAFVKRHMKVLSDVVQDLTEDAGSDLKGFQVELAQIGYVKCGFDEPYCSTVPECEFQFSFGKQQMIRCRVKSKRERDLWIKALGGERF